MRYMAQSHSLQHEIYAYIYIYIYIDVYEKHKILVSFCEVGRIEK